MQFKADKQERVKEAIKARRDDVLMKSQADIELWIDKNVSDMDDVRSYLKRLSRAVKANMNFEDL